jgi:hypothetical protein
LLCAGHVRQLEGGRLFDNLMEVKDGLSKPRRQKEGSAPESVQICKP